MTSLWEPKTLDLMRHTNRWRQYGVFFVACLTSCILMRLLMRQYDIVCTLSWALPSIGLGTAFAWRTLRRWRHTRPLFCAAVLGLYSGIGGSGLVTLMAHAIALLLPPYFGPTGTFS